MAAARHPLAKVLFWAKMEIDGRTEEDDDDEEKKPVSSERHQFFNLSFSSGNKRTVTTEEIMQMALLLEGVSVSAHFWYLQAAKFCRDVDMFLFASLRVLGSTSSNVTCHFREIF